LPAQRHGPVGLRPPAKGQELEGRTRNRRRAAVEQAVRHLPPGEILSLLLAWARAGGWEQDETLGRYMGRQMLRLLLLRKESSRRPATDEVVIAARALLGPSDLPDLVVGLLSPSAARQAQRADECPDTVRVLSEAARLWQGEGTGGCQREAVEAVAVFRESPPWGAPAGVLLVYEATRRGDAEAIANLLDPSAVWSRLPSGPPSFLARALQTVRPTTLSAERWNQVVGRWLRLWNPAGLNPAARCLAVPGRLLTPL